jgi:hypothetical protein
LWRRVQDETALWVELSPGQHCGHGWYGNLGGYSNRYGNRKLLRRDPGLAERAGNQLEHGNNLRYASGSLIRDELSGNCNEFSGLDEHNDSDHGQCGGASAFELELSADKHIGHSRHSHRS